MDADNMTEDSVKKEPKQMMTHQELPAAGVDSSANGNDGTTEEDAKCSGAAVSDSDQVFVMTCKRRREIREDEENGDTSETIGHQLTMSPNEPPEFPAEEVLEPIFKIPEEIWEMILAQVSFQDRLNFCRTNSMLDAMLGQGKSQWLFDQVLPYLLSHFTDKATILKCRQVCRKWRNFIDNMLENEHPNRRPFNRDHPIEKAKSSRAASHLSLRRWHLDYIQLSPRNSHKFSTCPSPAPIGRAISFFIIGTWDRNKLEEFWTAANAFLKSHGRHIWHFKVVHYNFHIDCLEFYTILCECLESLPNLRSLEIRSHLDKMRNSDDHAGILQSAMKTHPLPSLELLHSLDVEGVPANLHHRFLTQYSTSLKKCSFDVDSHFNYDRLEMNLQEIVVKRLKHCEDEWPILNVPSNCFNTCTKISLDLSRCDRITGNGLLYLLGRFRHLINVKIISHSSTRYVRPNPMRSRGSFPSLEYLEIERDGWGVFSFSSLLFAFPNLRHLHFRDTSTPGINEHRTVKEVVKDETLEIEQWLTRKQLHLSPIWDNLSRLQTITFESVNGTIKTACNREMVNFWRDHLEMNCEDAQD